MRTGISIHPIGMIWYYRPVIKQSRLKPARIFGVLGSVALHACLLFLGGAVLIKPIEFAVDRGQSGMEVQLVAGVEEPVKDAVKVLDPVKIIEPVVEKTVEPQPVVERMEVLEQIPLEAVKEIISTPATVEPPKAEEKKIEKVIPQQPVLRPVVKGNSPVNVSSSGQGAQTKAKPDYLSNPAPRYPLEARRNGWEGTVLIKAYINKEGYPENIEIERSSGHLTLDETALKTVGKWKFSPARIGKTPVESTAHLPVRFVLKDAE